MRRYTCFFHGTAQPNPGTLGLGVVVFDPDGIEIITAAVKGGKGSNNVGAYRALNLAFELCLNAGLDQVDVFGDSQVVINQVNGLWVVNNENLLPLQAMAQELGCKLNGKLTWVKKSDNTRARELSQKALSASSDFFHFAPNIQNVKDESLESMNEQPISQSFENNHSISQVVSEHSEAEQKPNNVYVKGLSGGKVAFIYGNDVVIFDLNSNHCTCSQFKIGASCKHAEAISRVSRSRESI